MSHERVVCIQCGTVIRSCRCIGPHETRYERCMNCATATAPRPSMTGAAVVTLTSAAGKTAPIHAAEDALYCIQQALAEIKRGGPFGSVAYFADRAIEALGVVRKACEVPKAYEKPEPTAMPGEPERRS